MSSKPLRIAMTGATGFVGANTASVICGKHHILTALVRDRQRATSLQQLGTNMVDGDLGNEAALDQLVAGADVVVHVAGAVSAVDKTGFMAVNVEGTRAVLNASRKAGVKRFVHVSSLAAREPQLSGYCGSKARAEDLFRNGDDLDWIIVRPPAVYGPGDKATLPLIQQLSRRTAWLTGTGTQRVSVIHVDDLAQALCSVAEGAAPARQVYEVDDGRAGGYDWAALAAAAGESLGFTPKVNLLPRGVLGMAGCVLGMAARVSGKPQILSPGKVRELYHPDWVIHGRRLDVIGQWKPATGFAAGFARTLKWYRQNGWLPQG